MRELTAEVKEAMKKEVYDFFAEESDRPAEEITDSLSVLEDLDGDSLMFVELVEMLKGQYNLDIQLQTVGKYLLKHPADTVGEVIETLYLVYQYENGIVELERE